MNLHKRQGLLFFILSYSQDSMLIQFTKRFILNRFIHLKQSIFVKQTNDSTTLQTNNHTA